MQVLKEKLAVLFQAVAKLDPTLTYCARVGLRVMAEPVKVGEPMGVPV